MQLLPGLSAEALTALAQRPDLWLTAAKTAHSLTPDNWWKRAPFVPVPDRDWLRFRIVTAYGGDGSASMTGHDLITYLEWKRSFPQH